MDSVTKIKKYGKNYHNQYYHEKRKFKKGILNEYIKYIPNTYALMDFEKYIEDIYEQKLLKEFECDLKIEYDLKEIKLLCQSIIYETNHY